MIQGDVLEIAAAAPARACPRAGRRHPVRGEGEDLDRLRAQVATLRPEFANPHPYALTGDGVSDENDLAVMPGDAQSSVRPAGHLDLNLGPRGEAGPRVSHLRAGGDP